MRASSASGMGPRKSSGTSSAAICCGRLEHDRMTSRPLDRLLRPQTIAVFGGREARRVIEQCDRMGFAGEIWPVHPKLDEVLGRRCCRSLSDLPAAPDAAFVGVNRVLTVDIVRGLSRAGAG